MSIVAKFTAWANKDHPRRKQIMALVVGALLVLVALPAAFLLLGPIFDGLFRPLLGSWMDILGLFLPPVDLILGGIIGGVGLGYALWAVIAEYQIGHGTPIPAVPTQNLVVVGPYKYSRNPMTFGSIIFYLGIAILVHSLGVIIAILVFFVAPLLTYIKLLEERELVARFGDAYSQYKTATSFLFPAPRHAPQ